MFVVVVVVFLCCYGVRLTKKTKTKTTQQKMETLPGILTWPVMPACAKIIVCLGESRCFAFLVSKREKIYFLDFEKSRCFAFLVSKRYKKYYIYFLFWILKN